MTRNWVVVLILAGGAVFGGYVLYTLEHRLQERRAYLEVVDQHWVAFIAANQCSSLGVRKAEPADGALQTDLMQAGYSCKDGKTYWRDLPDNCTMTNTGRCNYSGINNGKIFLLQ